MTPAQEPLRSALHFQVEAAVGTSDTTDEIVRKLIAAGLRVVGEGEVVVKRNSIREGWMDHNGFFAKTYDERYHAAHYGGRSVGVISPWPPEASS
jgi:hypothetical protein